MNLEGTLEAVVNWCELTCKHEQHEAFVCNVSLTFSFCTWTFLHCNKADPSLKQRGVSVLY